VRGPGGQEAHWKLHGALVAGRGMCRGSVGSATGIVKEEEGARRRAPGARDAGRFALPIDLLPARA